MNVLTNSDAFAGLSHGHFLTKTSNACKAWDSEADGYCHANTTTSLIIKRFEDAKADNDNILDVILSAVMNHFVNALSITHPHMMLVVRVLVEQIETSIMASGNILESWSRQLVSRMSDYWELAELARRVSHLDQDKNLVSESESFEIDG